MKNWTFDEFTVKTAKNKDAKSNYNVSVHVFYKNSMIAGFMEKESTKEIEILTASLKAIEDYKNRDINDVFFELAGFSNQ